MSSVGEKADRKKLSQRSKKGETLRWNPKKKSGWIYDGTWWRHYRNGKPAGKKEKHRITAKSPVAKPITQLYNLANPFHRKYEHVEMKKKWKAKRKAEREQKEKLKLQKHKDSVNEVLNQPKPVKKKKVDQSKSKNPYLNEGPQHYGQPKNKEVQENIKKSKEVIDKYKKKQETSKVKQDKSKVKASKTAEPKKQIRRSGREAMRAKNVERHGQARVDHLRAKHADFKKMKKKQMSKADFIKKYPKSITAQKAKGLRR